MQLKENLIIENYLFTKEIGRGGMGVVWEARHTLLEQRVAIKVISSLQNHDLNANERFIKEARAMAKLEHHNIVRINNFFIHNDFYFLVMPFVDGCSLEKKLDDLKNEQSLLSINEIFKIAIDVLNALEFAHIKGVIHRDIKPANIMITSVNNSINALLVDFGLAIIGGDTRHTRTGMTIGTPAYMSPEQIKSSKNIDSRSDIYSFGCVLYEMLTGKSPFKLSTDDNISDYMILHDQINKTPLPPSMIRAEISKKLENLVLKMLEKEPDNRILSCKEILSVLQNIELIESSNTQVISLTDTKLMLKYGQNNNEFFGDKKMQSLVLDKTRDKLELKTSATIKNKFKVVIFLSSLIVSFFIFYFLFYKNSCNNEISCLNFLQKAVDNDEIAIAIEKLHSVCNETNNDKICLLYAKQSKNYGNIGIAENELNKLCLNNSKEACYELGIINEENGNIYDAYLKYEKLCNTKNQADNYNKACERSKYLLK